MVINGKYQSNNNNYTKDFTKLYNPPHKYTYRNSVDPINISPKRKPVEDSH